MLLEHSNRRVLLALFPYLLRATEYSDDALRLSKHSLDPGSPRPNAGEKGLGVRGPAHNWSFSRFRSSSRAKFRELIWRRGIPLTPCPSPALGRGEPMLTTVLYQNELAEVSLNLKSSIGITAVSISWSRAGSQSRRTDHRKLERL